MSSSYKRRQRVASSSAPSDVSTIALEDTAEPEAGSLANPATPPPSAYLNSKNLVGLAIESLPILPPSAPPPAPPPAPLRSLPLFRQSAFDAVDCSSETASTVVRVPPPPSFFPQQQQIRSRAKKKTAASAEVSEDDTSSTSSSSSASVSEIDDEFSNPTKLELLTETKDQKKQRKLDEKAEVDKLLKKQKKRINKCVSCLIVPLGGLLLLKRVVESLF